MLRIDRLVLDNWCQHEHTEADFVYGTNGVIGSNGKGKSNLLLAGFTALTGKVLAGTIEENINYKAKSASLDMTFNISGMPARVYRKFSIGESGIKSNAKLVVGDVEITGASKVGEEIIRLTGLTPKTISDHIFIPQDKLVAMLFQPKAERLSAFMSIVGDLDKYEKLRATLATEIAEFPEVASPDLTVLTGRQTILEEEQLNIKLELDPILSALSGINLNAMRLAVESQDKYEKLNTQIRKLKEEITAVDAKRAINESKLKDETAKAVSLQETLKTLESDYRAALGAREYAEAAKKTALRRKELQGKLETLEKTLAELVEPVVTVTAEDVKTAQEALTTTQTELSPVAKLLNLLKSGVSDCPTCGTHLADSATLLEKTTKEHAALSSKLVKLVASHKLLSDAFAAETLNKQKYTRTVETTKASLISVKEALGGLPDIDIAGDVSAGASVINEYDAITEQQRIAQSSVNELRTAIAVLESRRSGLCSVLNNAESELSVIAPRIKTRVDKTELEQYEIIDKRRIELETHLNRAKVELDGIRSVFEAEALRRKKAESVVNYRKALEAIRDVLHRDKLPSDILYSKLSKLTQLTNKFLETFGNPFSVEFQRDMGIIFTMPNGYRSSDPCRLSGGQKCVLSVAFRFAVNELFAKHIGLLILDEPTAWMDDDNVNAIADLITKTQLLTKSSGVQTIIITHAKSMVSSFDNVISL